MSDRKNAIPNHTINTQTGFIESNAYPNVFDSDRKQAFLQNYKENGLRLRRACREMGLSESTVSKHLRIDPSFKKLFDAVEEDYLEELQATSRTNALNPKSVIERIFLLKCLLPEKYGQENKPQNQNISINFDGMKLEVMKKREDFINVEAIPSTPDLEMKSGDNHAA